jgi:hypothetical protein
VATPHCCRDEDCRSSKRLPRRDCRVLCTHVSEEWDGETPHALPEDEVGLSVHGLFDIGLEDVLRKQAVVSARTRTTDQKCPKCAHSLQDTGGGNQADVEESTTDQGCYRRGRSS